jgi:hypothetical protein
MIGDSAVEDGCHFSAKAQLVRVVGFRIRADNAGCFGNAVARFS